ncbi:undecaprenyldiphospho-muramoylpentapeptide beta-N-acetylglucosaminyltransferase [Thermodesulfobacteriota bacterium]
MDYNVLAGSRFRIEMIKSLGLKGKSALAVLRAVFQLPYSFFSAGCLIYRFKPDLVIGVGGYVTGPVLLAARLMGIPTCIHEQNSVPGLANRILGKIVHRICISLKFSEHFFPKRKTVLTGNPVRRDLLQKAQAEKKGTREGNTLLILGGSQGAHRVNELVVQAIVFAAEALPDSLKVIHQTGPRDKQWVRETYKKAQVDADVRGFFDDMAEVYARADLVISRAGATTLAEIKVFGLPSILIPYPFAADGHQEKNALCLVEAGAARMYSEKDLTARMLGENIAELSRNQLKREEMGAYSKAQAQPEATENIVDECLDLMKIKRTLSVR